MDNRIRMPAVVALSAVVLLSTWSVAAAHVGKRVIPIYDVSAPFTPILGDDEVADWYDVAQSPSITSADFFSILGDGSLLPDDLAVAVWLGWSATEGRIYFAVERIDDVYFNVYDGDPSQLWKNDYIEFMLDADHSGGQYDGFSETAYSADERKRLVSSQAQLYYAIASSPTERLMHLFDGAAETWATSPPWANVDGFITETDVTPHYSLIEGVVTPWDDLSGAGPQDSRRTELHAGAIIGLEVAIVDIDVAPGEYQGYYSLSGQRGTWKSADSFVDGMLLCASCSLPAESAVRVDSWGRIKAAAR